MPFPDASLACQPCQDEKFGFDLDANGFDLVSDANMELDSDETAPVTGDDDNIDPAGGDADGEGDPVSEADVVEVARIESLLGSVRETEIQSGPRNSLAAFAKMTGENPWLPFLHDQSPRAIAEKRLFLEMKDSYDRHTSPSTPLRGYEAFSTAWSQEVGQRYLARLAGVVDDSTETDIIYSKTAKQLAGFYDKLEAQERIATVLNTTESTRRQRNVNRVIRDSRANIVTPAAVSVEPMMYAQQLGGTVGRRTPLGAPLVLNTNIAFPGGLMAMNAHQSLGGAAPFLPPRLQTVQEITAFIPKGTYRKICQKCGRLRSDHPSKQFGARKCTFRHCARCLIPHERMGLACKARHGPNVRLDDLVEFDLRMKSILE